VKLVYLMRHAKAVQNPELADFDRHLVDRGKRDAAKMAKRMCDAEQGVHAIISSPAVRALETARIMAKVLGYPEESIIEYLPIYDSATDDDFLGTLQSLDDEISSVLICGHNPGINDFAELLAVEFGDWMPTSALIGIAVPIDSWKEIECGLGTALYYDFPKRDKKVVKDLQTDLSSAVEGVVQKLFPKEAKKQRKAIEKECRKTAKQLVKRWNLV